MSGRGSDKPRPEAPLSSRIVQPLITAWLAVIGLSGCGETASSAANQVSTYQGVIDSTLPIEEEIRRFQATVESLPTALRNGAHSRDELIRQFLMAVERHDTTVLAGLVLQRDEFIALYYPYTQFTTPPYEMSPSLLWFQMQNRSSRGISRLFKRDAGRRLDATGVHCEASPEIQGLNRLWRECRIEVADSTGQPRPRQLFGTILERSGVFKFLTFANEY